MLIASLNLDRQNQPQVGQQVAVVGVRRAARFLRVIANHRSFLVAVERFHRRVDIVMPHHINYFSQVSKPPTHVSGSYDRGGSHPIGIAMPLVADHCSDRVEFWEYNIFFHSSEASRMAETGSLMACPRNLIQCSCTRKAACHGPE
jgi:hypothetical protein